METILEIIEVDGYQPDADNRWHSFEGFMVKTEKQLIKLLISDRSNCCEHWGFFWMNDEPKDFLGATVISVEVVDDALHVKKVPDFYEGGIMFVNILTDRGVLQFTAYNSHNGYYSHEAIVKCEQLDTERYL